MPEGTADRVWLGNREEEISSGIHGYFPAERYQDFTDQTYAPQNYYWDRSAYLRDPDGHLLDITNEK